MIKDNLKTYRESIGLSQSGLAKELGISHQRYNYYETGRREPDQQMLQHIAKYYGIPVSALIDGKNGGDYAKTLCVLGCLNPDGTVNHTRLNEILAILQRNEMQNTQRRGPGD